MNSCLIFLYVFKQDEYVREGLEWESVDYVDNSTCLSLMVGKPTGMIWLLDEECRYGALRLTLKIKMHPK